ncbi:toxic anion resistance protein [Rhodobacteraceae bacterium NNCM2]|nr:toxic anion resistance protein [Coraliihabitans acroporae]
MSEIDKKAVAVAEQAEQELAPLPEVKGELAPVTAATATQDPEIAKRMGEIDMTSTQSIITFGAGAQQRLTALSDQMLEGVRNKDVGPAGDSLREMVTTIRGFDASELDPNQQRSWWERLFSKATPIADFVARYEGVQGQIDMITDNLLGHETTLLKDVKFLDKLYEETLNFYDEIGLYIGAGEAKLDELDNTVIPAKKAAVDAASEDAGVMLAQELRDLHAARDELERRVHDMKLTRTVTMQSLPSIRLVQENDKSLINKINSVLTNTVPLWKNQLAQGIAIFHSKDAAENIKAATDLTNDLLKSNADTLQTANREVRTQMERGIFDIEAVKHANKTLIDTINESLAIADEGKKQRAVAEAEMQKMEAELKATLASAKAREMAPSEPQANA